MTSAPSYLTHYQSEYDQSPRQAALHWFREAQYGLFLHYGLYSLLGRHEWVQLREKIAVADYEKLAGEFTATRFDAQRVADFALECGMRYINFTTRHHDSFCLFGTEQTSFNSVNSPARRDLVAELSTACAERGLGLFLYYSHGRDWRHPHAPMNSEWGHGARPDYNPPETSYAYGEDYDMDIYLEFMKAQVRELLTQYGPVAGIWLDGIMTPLSGDHTKFKCQDLYDLVHSLQPQVLVSYKQGLLGTEDFVTPEDKAIVGEHKLGEINTPMAWEPRSWGWMELARGKHRGVSDVWRLLTTANDLGFNLCINTGPLPDGSLDPEDESTLRAVGARLRAEGFPSNAAPR